MGPPAARNSQSEKDFLDRELTCLLLRNSKIAVYVNLTIAALTFLAFQSEQGIWLLLIAAAAISRLGFYIHYSKKLDEQLNFTLIHNRLIVLITIQGAAWGAASYLLYIGGTDLNKFYLIAIVCGMSGGSILTLAPSFLAFTCFTLPAVVPLVVVLLLEQGTTYNYAGIMGLIFLVAVHLLARKLNLFNLELLKSNRNLDLTAKELAEHKNHLEQLIDARTKELQVSREKYRRLTEQINEAIFELSPAGSIIYISPVISSILDYTPYEVTGRNLTELVFGDDQGVVGKFFDDAEAMIVEPIDCRLCKKDGKLRWVRLSCRTVFGEESAAGFRGSISDIEIQKQAENEKVQLLQRSYEYQKLESIITLAGGMAHEFNNLLMVIQGHASLLSAKLKGSTTDREHLEVIESQVRKAKNLTAQLLGSASGGKYDPRPVDINELLTKSTSIFERGYKNIKITRKIRGSPIVINADKQQIEQVFLNLFVNACEAMPDGGDLIIEASSTLLDDEFCQPFQVKSGQFAEVSFTDSGVGMAEETQHRIFDPFFTTKGEKRGTGLGLASAYGIIKNHNGFLTVDSDIGKGSTFKVYVPVSDEKLPQKTLLRSGKIEGRETVMIVDDDRMILEVSEALLQGLGYTVHTAESGEIALEKIELLEEEIDLVILDMIMPGMDGNMTYDKIRNQQPSLPVLLCSGYSLDDFAQNVMEKGCNGFIQKPFSLAELSIKIREILDYQRQ